jgi:alpha-L-rhamnosidase
VSRTDRRTFLKNTARASGLVAASAVFTDTVWPDVASSGAAEQQGDPPGPLAVGSMDVNGMSNAIGVDPDQLFFAWKLVDPRRGARQSAYRLQVVQVASWNRPGTLVWDTGTVAGPQQAFVPYAGPRLDGDASYELRVSSADAEGVYGSFTGTRFSTGLRDSDWSGQWLQPGQASENPEIYRYLRKEVRLAAGQIVRATAYVAAAHKYRLHVNGTEVDSGPSFSYPDESYYQATDLTGYLRPGQSNVIGALHHWYGPGKGRPTSAPGFLAQVSVHYSDGRRAVIATDASWKEFPGEWLPGPQRNNTVGDFVENIDGRLTPLGWSEPSYDAGHWNAVKVLGSVGTSPFTHLYAQRTRIVETEVEPVSVRQLSSGAVVVDFGKVYAARPTVLFRNGIDGRTIPMHVGYLLDDDGHVSTIHGTQMTNLSFSYIQRTGEQRFVPYTYIGFRYLEIDDPGESIAAEQVVALARKAAMPTDQTATFACDNQTVNDVFALTAHSCQYCSQEQFIDTPTREKGPFLWDSAQSSLAVMRLFGEQNLTFQGLRDFARSQARFWPNGNLNALYPNSDGARYYATFTAIYPEWVWQYYLNTGDRSTMESLYPTLQNVSSFLYSYHDIPSGLLVNLLQSPGDDPEYGYDFDVVTDTAVNVLSANALDRIASIGQVVGDIAGATLNRQRAQALVAAVNARLVRGDGIYVDGLRPGGVQSPHASQLANLLPLAYNQVPAANLSTVGAYVRSLQMDTSPDHGFQLLQALAAARLQDAVVNTLTDPSVLGWANILRQGATFTWEVWQPSDLIGDSMSHGWGSSALVAIQQQLLGVSLEAPPSPGTVAVSVSPPLEGVGGAEGTVPTVGGPVVTTWRGHGTTARLELDVPANVSATVTMPASSAKSVTESGRPLRHVQDVSVLSAGDGAVRLLIGSGHYSFASA